MPAMIAAGSRFKIARSYLKVGTLFPLDFPCARGALRAQGKSRGNRVPTFRYERAILKREPAAIIAGIDEVGCAPLAGPVVAAAVILDQAKLPKVLRQGLD